jgi:hypothetical protein
MRLTVVEALVLLATGLSATSQKVGRKVQSTNYVIMNSKQIATILHVFPELRGAYAG